MLYELGNEERDALCLSRDRLREQRVGGRVIPQELTGEVLCLLGSQGIDGDVAYIDLRVVETVLGQHAPQKRAVVRFVAAIHTHEEDRGWVGGAEQVQEQASTVRITPLKIIDLHHQWLVVTNAQQEVLECLEGLVAQFVGVAGLVFGSPSMGDCADTSKDREELGERVDVARQQLGGLFRRKLHHVAAQGVDDVVERLVWHALALIAAAAQDDCSLPLDEFIGEATGQGGLAHAADSVDKGHHRLAGRQ